MNRIIPFVIICALLNISAYADGTHPTGIKLDGTVGTAGKIELPGPDYQIRAEYGKQSGTNLFHSFEQFNIHNGESATFSGPASVKNIISRVTGGSASWIDGKLASAIPGADLYFLNPSGVMFGANASLDLSGSFHVSTADYLRMGNNERFYSTPMANEILSVAAPSAFGFLSDHPAGISAEGSFLAAPTGKTLSFIGGNIAFHNTTLVAPEGRVNLASAAAAGEVSLSDTGIGMNGIEKQGSIAITRDTDFIKITGTDYTWADITAAGINNSGEIFIRGGRFELRGGAIAANIFGSGNGKEINISVTEDMILDGAGINLGGRILNSTYASGNAGNIAIEAKNLTLDNRSEIAAETYGTGSGGEIRLNVSTLTIGNVSDISSGSGGVAQGGNISVSAAESVRVSGMSESGHSGIYAAALNSGAGGEISVDTPDLVLDKGGVISVNTLGAGNAGEISLSVNTLTMTEKGAVTADTSGAGHGGNININAETAVNISGSGSRINVNSYTGGGSGGNIQLNAPELTMNNHGLISAYTSGNGNSGSIMLNVGKLAITGSAEISSESIGNGKSGNIGISAGESVDISGNMSGIYANSHRTGNGGDILVNTPDLHIDRGGMISSGTYENGDAGEVRLEVGRLTLSEKGIVSADTSGNGNGGSIIISAADFVNIYGKDENGYNSGIFASTYGSGSGGKIFISAPHLSLSRDGIIVAGSKGDGTAGEITLHADTLIVTDGAYVSNEIFGKGNGNDMNISAAESVIISGKGDFSSGFYSSAYSGGGRGGNITLSAPVVSLDNEGVISAETYGSGSAGEINLNVKNLNLSGGAYISTETYRDGEGGNINISAEKSVMLSGYGEYPSGLYASTEDIGNAGNIYLNIGSLRLDSDATVSSRSNSPVNGGEAGLISVNAADSVILSGKGSITTEAESAGGGKIRIHAGNRIYLNNSDITSSVRQGFGNGGDVSASSKFVILNQGNITANAQEGDGGAVFIHADNFLKSAQSILDASSARGNQGTVKIDAPDLDITGSLIILSGGFINTSRWAFTSCDERYEEPISHFFIRRYIVQPVPFEDYIKPEK